MTWPWAAQRRCGFPLRQSYDSLRLRHTNPDALAYRAHPSARCGRGGLAVHLPKPARVCPAPCFTRCRRRSRLQQPRFLPGWVIPAAAQRAAEAVPCLCSSQMATRKRRCSLPQEGLSAAGVDAFPCRATQGPGHVPAELVIRWGRVVLGSEMLGGESYRVYLVFLSCNKQKEIVQRV